VKKLALHPTLGADLKRLDAHVIEPEEYEELPEMTDWPNVLRNYRFLGAQVEPKVPLRALGADRLELIGNWGPSLARDDPLRQALIAY
jgi:hypothetical protein